MSAYLCSDTHTCVLALYFAREHGQTSTGLVTAVAQNLRYLNSHALHCRYSDKPEPLPDDIMPALARATAWLETASPADIFGAVRGFRYQCAEGDAPELEEWKLLETISAMAEFEAGGKSSEVWAIDDDTPPPVPPQPAPGPEHWKAKEAAKQSVVEALRASNPHLVPADGKGGALVAAAKNCRIELKAAFPGVKFSVKTSRFSGGDAMDVRWTDGPTSDQVSAIAGRYSAGSFSGMDDSYTYSGSAWLAAFWDAKYVHCTRDDSDRAIESAIRTVRAKYAGNFEAHNIATPSAEDYREGRLWNVLVIDGSYVSHDGLESLISRELHRRTWCLTARSVKTETETEDA